MATRNYTYQSNHVSPLGIASYPYLFKPDTGFGKPGYYKVDLIITATEAKEIKAIATKLASEFKKEDVESNPTRKKWGLHLPLLDDVDRDTKEPTGQKIARFKQLAVIQTRDGKEIKKTIGIVDSKGNRIPGADPRSGTKMFVSYQMSAYASATNKTYGVIFRLIAAQIIEMVEAKDSDKTYGFKSQSSGFVVEQQADDETEIMESNETDIKTEQVSSVSLSSEEETTGEEVPF